mmetsp:Transcript_5510/g.13417  ORF Transcript_5510/g.13417 Transcript_5510/m.13417 type:complete len:223 (+) Transcript_5510:1179-1847(+)
MASLLEPEEEDLTFFFITCFELVVSGFFASGFAEFAFGFSTSIAFSDELAAVLGVLEPAFNCDFPAEGEEVFGFAAKFKPPRFFWGFGSFRGRFEVSVPSAWKDILTCCSVTLSFWMLLHQFRLRQFPFLSICLSCSRRSLYSSLCCWRSIVQMASKTLERSSSSAPPSTTCIPPAAGLLRTLCTWAEKPSRVSFSPSSSPSATSLMVRPDPLGLFGRPETQ